MRYRGDGTGTSRPEGQPQQGPLCKCRACTAPNPSRPSCRNALLNAHLRGSPAKVTECACEVYTTYVGAGRGAEVKRVCRTAVQLQSCRPPRSLIRVVQTEGRITDRASVCLRTCARAWSTGGHAERRTKARGRITSSLCSSAHPVPPLLFPACSSSNISRAHRSGGAIRTDTIEGAHRPVCCWAA